LEEITELFGDEVGFTEHLSPGVKEVEEWDNANKDAKLDKTHVESV
jgi:hypothetical protein